MALRIRTNGLFVTHQEYLVDFFGEVLMVTVTSDPSVISSWICDVQFFPHPLVVGLGVQWTPRGFYSLSKFYGDSLRESNYLEDFLPDLADTLQLCVNNRCIIIQLSHCDCIPDALRSFVRDQEKRFVGVWNSQDARRLKETDQGLWILDLMDLRKYVEDSHGNSLKSCSFKEIVEVCLDRRGVRLDLAISMSDWSAYNLCDDQILQASIYAFVCCKIAVRNRLWEV